MVPLSSPYTLLLHRQAWHRLGDHARRLSADRSIAGAHLRTALYERRLLHALRYASSAAEAANRRALVTIPGLGCGQFAGPFRGTLGTRLRDAIASILQRHVDSLTGFRGHYNTSTNTYAPPADVRTWEELVVQDDLRLRAAGEGKELDESQ